MAVNGLACDPALGQLDRSRHALTIPFRNQHGACHCRLIRRLHIVLTRLTRLTRHGLRFSSLWLCGSSRDSGSKRFRGICQTTSIRERSRTVKRQSELEYARPLPYTTRVAKKRKNPAAVALGRKGGKKGGPARAASMTPKERSESARKAVLARWAKAKTQ